MKRGYQRFFKEYTVTNKLMRSNLQNNLIKNSFVNSFFSLSQTNIYSMIIISTRLFF